MVPDGRTNPRTTAPTSPHEPPEAEASDASVAKAAWTSFYELVFSSQSHDRMHDACESMGITPGLMKALLSMRPGQPRPMKELAGEWRCDASYVTSLVDGLEERGIVQRRPHATDRRAKVVVLTAEGERSRAMLLDRIHEPPPCFDALSPAEVRDLRDLLAKLVAAVDTEA